MHREYWVEGIYERVTGLVYSILVPRFLGSKPVSPASHLLLVGRVEEVLRKLENLSSAHPGRITQTLLTPALLISGLVGVWIAASDGWLRAIAPSHAYGLLTFAALDIVLAFVVMVVPKLGYVGALLASTTQVAVMAGDALTFTPTGTLQAAFRAYLLSDTAFVVLLGIQLAVAGITATAIATPHGVGHKVHFDQATHPKSLS
jgi:hypothetical protein